MRKTIIHIGANKTASTTLQRQLFCKHTGLHYVGEDGAGYAEYADIVNSMASDDDLFFPEEACTRLFEKHKQADPDKTLLYSNEDVMTSRIPAICAKRLHKLLPDAEILLVIRNQYTAIPSFYANHGAFLKPAPPSYFRRHVSLEEWIRYQTMFMKYGAFAGYKYDQLLNVYAELFGKDRVHVLLFEEFVQNKPSFVNKLSEILSIDPAEANALLQTGHERKRLTGRMLAYNRFRTSFFWGFQFSRYLPFGQAAARLLDNYLSAGTPAKVPLSDEIKKQIFDLYSSDNASLAKKYNLPLEKYGYPVAPI